MNCILQGALQAASKKSKKKDKKVPRPLDDDFDLASPSTPAEPQIEKTAEELADEEWALPVKAPKKGKGKKSKPKDDGMFDNMLPELQYLLDGIDEEPVSPAVGSGAVTLAAPDAVAPAATLEPAGNDDGDDGDDDGTGPTKVLSKKEKEKLKKERDKVSP